MTRSINYHRSSSPASSLSLPSYHSNNEIAQPAPAHLNAGLDLHNKAPARSTLSRARSFVRRHRPQASQPNAPANVYGAPRSLPHMGEEADNRYPCIGGMLWFALVFVAIVAAGIHPVVATKDCPAKPELPNEKQTRYTCEIWSYIGSATLGILAAKSTDRGIRFALVWLSRGQYYTSSRLAGLRNFVRCIVPVLTVFLGVLIFWIIPWYRWCFLGCVSYDDFPPPSEH